MKNVYSNHLVLKKLKSIRKRVDGVLNELELDDGFEEIKEADKLLYKAQRNIEHKEGLI